MTPLLISYNGTKNDADKASNTRFDVEAVGDGFTWRRAASSLELDEDTLDDQMRDRIASGARSLKEDAFVKAGVLALVVSLCTCVRLPIRACERSATRIWTQRFSP